MANLRGGSFEKQIKDAFHRLEKFGESRHGKNSHATHSVGLAEKRSMFLRDYKAFAEREQIAEKLNQSMNDTNINKFLDERLLWLARSTQENYIRSFSSMLKGLEEANVTINISKNIFNDKVAQLKSHNSIPSFRGDRAIKNVEEVIKELYEYRYESGLLADIQNSLGLRISEGLELISQPEKYIQNGEVVGIIGKGNHEYEPKEISPELVAKINLVETIPHQNTFRSDLSIITQNEHTPHDFRFTFSLKQFETKIQEGIEYHQALKEVSIELNHSREEMTHYYLKRA